VLWRCWLGGRKGIRPVKKLEWWDAGMVICLGQGAGLHMAQLMPLPLAIYCSSKSRLAHVCLVGLLFRGYSRLTPPQKKRTFEDNWNCLLQDGCHSTNSFRAFEEIEKLRVLMPTSKITLCTSKVLIYQLTVEGREVIPFTAWPLIAVFILWVWNEPQSLVDILSWV